MVAVALYALLPQSLLLGPRLLVPVVEGVLLVALVATNPRRLTRQTRLSRLASLGLAAVVVLTNLTALGILVAELSSAQAGQPEPLLLAALQVWATNVIGFALIYWELDRGGPVSRARCKRARAAAGGLAVLPGRERRHRDRGVGGVERPLGLDPASRGLPLPLGDQLQRVQPDRHDAPDHAGRRP